MFLGRTVFDHYRAKREVLITFSSFFRFELADRPNSEIYQFSCHGRHKEHIVFSGQIVPILNKMLKASGFVLEHKERKRKSWHENNFFAQLHSLTLCM